MLLDFLVWLLAALVAANLVYYLWALFPGKRGEPKRR